MTFAKIAATGSFLPEEVITNSDLEKRIDTSDEWIAKRTGIRRRHVSGDDDTVTSMGVTASKRALITAGWQAEDIDLIIVATCTPEQMFPSTACCIQEALGVSICIAFDVTAACSGFIYALSIATQFIENKQLKRVLVIGSEVMSRVVDWQDRSTCVLFADGAGAVLLEASDQPGVLATKLMADGKHKDLLYLNNAKLNPDTSLVMQGNAIFKLAVKSLGDIAEEIIAQANLTAEEIDWIVPHQANIRILQATAKKLGISMDKVIVTVDDQANTSSASVPLALDLAIKDGRIQPGQNLLLEAFGGGLTWGAAIVKYF